MRKFSIVFLIFMVLGLSVTIAQTSLGTPNQNDAILLAKMEKGYTAAKKSYQHHKSAKTREDYVIATVRFGTTSMVASVLPPRTKYKQALRLYREALKLDPNNHEAKSNSELIISIYRSMHRPVPN